MAFGHNFYIVFHNTIHSQIQNNSMNQKPNHITSVYQNLSLSLLSTRRIFSCEVALSVFVHVHYETPLRNPAKMSQLEIAKKLNSKQEVPKRLLIIKSYPEFRFEMFYNN